jgi:hypothetical protein
LPLSASAFATLSIFSYSFVEMSPLITCDAVILLIVERELLFRSVSLTSVALSRLSWLLEYLE